MNRLFIYPIIFYQVVIATSLRALGLKSECRYPQTCSEYTKRAILKHGLFKGTALGVKRILSCSPIHI